MAHNLLRYRNNTLLTWWQICCVVLLSPIISQDLNAQEALSWDNLADVVFEEEYDEATESFWLMPTFGEHLKSYQNKLVHITGYLINLDLDYALIILSKNPYSSCFFCGMAGPETIVEIQLKVPVKDIKVDQRARIKGELYLNKSDFDHFNYILKNAVVELME